MIGSPSEETPFKTERTQRQIRKEIVSRERESVAIQPAVHLLHHLLVLHYAELPSAGVDAVSLVGQRLHSYSQIKYYPEQDYSSA